MRMLFKAVVLVAMVAVAMSPCLLAQWKSYPTPGVPRTPTGEPNLTAPAPRTADGKVDFTGIWQTGRGGGGQRAGGGGGGGRGAAAPAPDGGPRGAAPPAPDGGGRGAAAQGGARGGRGTPPTPVLPPDGIPIATFGNAGQGFPDGLPMQPWAADLVKKRQADNSKDNPDAHCLPMGFLQFHNHPEPRKIIQTKDVMVIIYEANSGLRQIFLDGRPLPDADAEPWWYGYSVGKWEGDTLVVETRGFRGDEWLDVRGSPLTEAAKVTEKFRRPNYGSLDIEITVDDPKAYTKPWTVRIYQRVMVDTELIEFICEDRDATHYVGAEKSEK
jgi:hypothetical protein